MIKNSKYQNKIILSVVLFFFIVLVVVSALTSYQHKIKTYISEGLVREGVYYVVNDIDDIDDYSGKDTIFTIDIDNIADEQKKLEIITFANVENGIKFPETYIFIDEKDMNIKYSEEDPNKPIKFSFPVDAGLNFSYKIGVIEDGKRLIYYTDGSHKASDQSIEDKLIEEYKEYIIQTQENMEKNKEIYGENTIENEIDLEEYEELLKADPDDIDTWPQFILDKIYNNEF